MNGKGHRRRPAAISDEEMTERWSAIDWAKGRPPAPAKVTSVSEALVKDYTRKEDWVIPSFESMFGHGKGTAR